MLHNNIPLTFILVAMTVAITFLAWRDFVWQDYFMGYPYRSYHLGEWYRSLAHGFIHGDLFHLLFNMYTLYAFGRFVGYAFNRQFGAIGYILYLLLYIGGIVSAGLVDIWFHKNSMYYRSLGASAGVSAIVLSHILFNPFSKILIHGFIPVPSWLYGIGYLATSYYMIGNGSGINHLAHLTGSIYGMVFTLVTHPYLLRYYIALIKVKLGL